jgi:hypothetical protein
MQAKNNLDKLEESFVVLTKNHAEVLNQAHLDTQVLDEACMRM